MLIRPHSTFSIELATDDGAFPIVAPIDRREIRRRTVGVRTLIFVLAYAALAGLATFFAIEPSGAFVVLFFSLGLPLVCAPLFARRRIAERVTINQGIICISFYVDGELVDRRRVRAIGIGIVRRADEDGDCERVEIEGADREFEIARHFSPGERDRIVERLMGALCEAGVEARVRTVCEKPPRAARECADPRLWTLLCRTIGKLRMRHDASAGASVFIRSEVSTQGNRPSEFDATPGRGADVATVKWLKAPWVACAVVATLLVYPMLQATSHSRDANVLRKIVPAFRLTSSKGEAVDDRAMLGRPYAIFFGFTKCPEVCPTTLLELTRVVKEMGVDAPGFEILFVTLDAERDTPSALSDFVESFEYRVISLSGTTEEIARAAQAFRVYHRKVPLDGGGYTIDHTTLVYLVDRHGGLADTISFVEQADIASKRLKAFILDETASSSGRSERRAAGGRRARGVAKRTAKRERRFRAHSNAIAGRTRDNMPHCAWEAIA
ncbi:MAG: hypothetical protein C3F11_02125 [Methylocystaceae bacterium]|nr:MAG: hypothetical protein C3F11_02125 [Methylocystaceae bacterium]